MKKKKEMSNLTIYYNINKIYKKYSIQQFQICYIIGNKTI